MDELELCPFCRGRSHLASAHCCNQVYIGTDGFAKELPVFYRVFCEDCIAQTCQYEEPKDAIKAWNRRDKDG
jgi:hypothetical protein